MGDQSRETQPRALTILRQGFAASLVAVLVFVPDHLLAIRMAAGALLIIVFWDAAIDSRRIGIPNRIRGE